MRMKPLKNVAQGIRQACFCCLAASCEPHGYRACACQDGAQPGEYQRNDDVPYETTSSLLQVPAILRRESGVNVAGNSTPSMYKVQLIVSCNGAGLALSPRTTSLL